MLIVSKLVLVVIPSRDGMKVSVIPTLWDKSKQTRDLREYKDFMSLSLMPTALRLRYRN